MFWAFNRELRNFKGRRTAENSNISSILGWEQKNKNDTNGGGGKNQETSV